MSLEGSATAACPKNDERNAALSPGCPGVLCRSLNPVLYQCLVKTNATSGGKGHGWSTMEKKSEGGVWFELSVYGGSKGWGVTEELFGSEATGTGRGFVQELYEESAASCGLHGGWISGTTDTYGRKGQFPQMAVVFLMFTHYRERPILLRRRRDLNTEGKKMYEINGGLYLYW